MRQLSRFTPFLVLLLSLSGPALIPGLAHGADDPPKQLTPEEAKRIDQLDRSVQNKFQAGRYVEAVEPAREIFETRTRALGADHWLTISARNNLEIFKKSAALPPEAQAALTEVTRLERQDYPRLFDKGDYKGALAIAERVTGVRQRHLGNECLIVATSLNNQARCLYELSQFDQAEKTFRQVVALSEKVYGKDHPSTGAAYGNLAMSLERLDQYQEGRKFKEKVLPIYLRAYGACSESVALAYHNLASNYEHLGDYNEAEKLYGKALEIFERLSGPEAERKKATTLDNLGGILNKKAKYPAAERHYQLALEIRKRLLGDDHPDVVCVYNNLGVCLGDQSKYADAEVMYRKSLAILRLTHADDHLRMLQGYSNLSVALANQSKLHEAERLLRRALHLQATARGNEDHSTAIWLTNLAKNLHSQGRDAEAVQALEHGRAIMKRIFGPKHPLTASADIDLAVTMTRQGKYTDAVPIYQEAVEAFQKQLGTRHPTTAQARANLAGNLYFFGNYGEAEKVHREVLAVFQEYFGERHPQTAWAYKNVIMTLLAQGKYAEAEQMAPAAAVSFEEGRRNASFSGLDRSAFAAETSPLSYLAALAARNGRPAQAWRYLEQSLARGLLDELATRPWTDEERGRDKKLSLEISVIESEITTLLSSDKDTDQTEQRVTKLSNDRDKLQKDLAELRRELTRKYGPAVGDVYDLPRIQETLPADAALVAWLDLEGAPKGHNPHGEHWICIVRKTGAPTWVRLQGTGPNGAWIASDRDLATQVRKLCSGPGGLPGVPDATRDKLAESLFTQRLAPAEACFAAADAMPAVRHLIVLPSEKMQGVPVEVLTEAVKPGQYTVSYAPSGTMFAWLQQKRKESGHLLKPPGDAHILAVGDPVMADPRPRGMLPAPPDHGVFIAKVELDSNASKNGLKVRDVIFQYGETRINTVGDLTVALQRAAATPESTKKLVVQLWRDGQIHHCQVDQGKLGVELSNSAPGEAIRSQRELDDLLRRPLPGNLTRLRGAEREVNALAGIFWSIELRKGSAANEQNLRDLASKNLLRQFRYLHFATHGVLEPKSPLHSALVLSQDQLPDPLQVSTGHAFDGRVTAEEIIRDWKLDADLVTLSACETGLGKYTDGEGYLGFSQALFLSGARSLVLSLWKVDDASTALLMTRFYENLAGHRSGMTEPMPKRRALAEAKTWLRGLRADEAELVGGGLIRGLDTDTARGEIRAKPAKQARPKAVYPYVQPYYWAGFILVGDPM